MRKPVHALCLLLCSCVRSNDPDVATRRVESSPSAAYLSLLPDGEEKRRFILDCTGCHTFDETSAYPNGTRRTREGWETAINRMLSFAGPQSGFPVISVHRDAGATSQWLNATLPLDPVVAWRWPSGSAGQADIREYMLPAPQDLPHDLAVYARRVVVTGMFTARMYILNPENGEITTEPTPKPNPRAVEIDRQGNWWVVLGSPNELARRARDGSWRTYPTGFYAHSVALEPNGAGAWVNGHFTHAPELLRRIGAADGSSKDVTVPEHPNFTTTTVPYEVRVSPAGEVWLSELLGNRIVRYEPRTSRFDTWLMPTSASGPRRFDISPNGMLWIPEYSANKLARFDPGRGQFKEYELPLKDAAPYVARWDNRRRVVWIGTGAADAVFRFDPGSEKFIYYRLPSTNLLVRHLVVDSASGDIWLAPGASPGTAAARVIRLRPGD